MQTMPNSQYPASQPLTAAAKPPQPVDSDASLRPESEMNPAWPAVFYPTATPGEMFRCLNSRTPRLFADLTGYLVMLPEPDLYLLAAAVFWLHQHPEAVEELGHFVLRWRTGNSGRPRLRLKFGHRDSRRRCSPSWDGAIAAKWAAIPPARRVGEGCCNSSARLRRCPVPDRLPRIGARCWATARFALHERNFACCFRRFVGDASLANLAGGLLEFGQEILYAAMGHPTTGTVSS